MLDMTSVGWERLRCKHCEGERFVRMFHLKWTPGGGKVDEPAGEQCVKCGGMVDVRELIDQAQIRHKRAELAALQQQIGGTSPDS